MQIFELYPQDLMSEHPLVIYAKALGLDVNIRGKYEDPSYFRKDHFMVVVRIMVKTARIISGIEVSVKEPVTITVCRNDEISQAMELIISLAEEGLL